MNFLRQVVDLMLFRCGPQDLPGDQRTLIISAAAYCILLITQIALLVGFMAGVIVQAVLVTLLLGLYVGILLRWRGLSNRFHQTATGLYATGAVLTALMLVPTAKMRPFVEALSHSTDPANVPMPSLSFALIYLVVGIWALAIYSHIYRHALGVSILLGVLTAIGYEAFLMLVFTVIG